MSLTGFAEIVCNLKCEFMSITRKTNCEHVQPASNPSLYGQPLERVSTYKYFGLMLSSAWSQHINNICNY